MKHYKKMFVMIETVTQKSSVKEVFLEISQNSQEKRYSDKFFPVDFVKFLKTHFFTEHLGWHLL